MEDNKPQSGKDGSARRDFLKKSAKLGMTAPAVGILLSASAKSQAQIGYTTTPPPPTTPAPTTPPPPP